MDANAFARRDWMEPLLAAAQAGHVQLIWSPAIIAEASRVLQWIWLQQRGGRMTEGLKREAFDIARRWFHHMTAVFVVAEDCPPYEPQWTDTPRDADDRPIWTAAVRAGAHVVVTENLRDGPPVDDLGFQTWDGIMYLHPDRFVSLLDGWQNFSETLRRSEAPATESGAIGTVAEKPEVPLVFQDFLRDLFPESDARSSTNDQ